ncbi:carbohydrate ABC transporter permease [Pseudonocardia kunmingensis]|uniref:Carbohydrate ABC transporter membrane protein 1 (CUT1 family) n=1 Tax=Pseudonocardia kunmingensis TaxID=630975 RepID=A0A543DWY2_9PSEU|nr:sugar ABC transporter permease [Pseudonocardia kunmingensis]TQM13821.1 carbohydrate ABC transporter membrane protein 1 (CUT1 family) [Pseudonocardia kunmingensis]
MTAGTVSPVAPTASAPPPSGSGPSRRTREALAAYGFLSPWIVGMLLLTIGPMLYSLYLSFTRYNLMTPAQWVGFDNYVRMFTADPRYLASVGVTLRYVAISVPLLLVVSLLVAMVLNKGLAFLSGYRAAFYLPSLIASSVAIAVLWRQVFGQDGIVNEALALVGIEGGSWIGNPGTALYTLVVLHVWSFGSTMIIFLAGLRQVPKELYEAAAVDGAGAVRRFLHITLPMLTPLIFFNLLLSTVNAFQAFTPAYVISNGEGGPLDSTLFYTLYLYQRGFANLEMGYASAMAWALVVVLALFTAGLFASARFWVHYGDER